MRAYGYVPAPPPHRLTGCIRRNRHHPDHRPHYGDDDKYAETETRSAGEFTVEGRTHPAARAGPPRAPEENVALYVLGPGIDAACPEPSTAG